MPCHKGFAPCLRVTEGDRRVTGWQMWEKRLFRVILGSLKSVYGMGLLDDKCLEAKQFSREFEGLKALKQDFGRSKPLNSLENSKAFGILFAVR